MIEEYLRRVLRELDLLLNVLTGGASNETVTERARRHREQPWARALCAALEILDPGHCRDAGQVVE